MTLELPQIILTLLLVFGMGASAARYGQPKKMDSYDITDVLIGPAIMFGLLWWGGFYG